MRRRLAAAAAGLLLLAGCDRMVRRDPPRVYGSWEEGLTLVYTNPSQPSLPRLQVRVKKCVETPAGRKVTVTYASLSGQAELDFRLKDGGIALLLDGGNEITVLPEGFPDRVDHWRTPTYTASIIGRSRVDLPGLDLPEPDVTGVWIEVAPAGSPIGLRRTLYVPDIGEVETLTLRNGAWVVTNRLASRGFSDPPTARSTP